MRLRNVWRGGVMAAGGSAVAVGIVVAVAGPAFAHTASAVVTETCVNGTSQANVSFINNFALGATVTYSGPASGSLALPAVVGGTNGVTVVVPSPGNLTYTVLWTDGVTQGVRSVPLVPITDCLPPPTTTTTTTTIEVAPSTPPTTVAPPASTAPEVIDTVSPPVAQTVLADRIVPESTSTPSTAVTALPRTGFDPALPVGVAVGLIIVGAVLVASRRRPDHV